MDNDSGFVNWGDYFGLNQGAADKMAGDLTSGTLKGDADPAKINDLIEKHYGAARAAGEGTDAGTFKRTGDAVQAGLMSYGDAVRRLRDPAERQALMSKQYGQRVSDLDAGMAGQAGGATFDAGEKNLNALTTRAESKSIDAENRMNAYRRQTIAQQAADAADVEQRQARYDAREKQKMAKKWLESEGIKMTPTRDKLGNANMGDYEQEALKQDRWKRWYDERASAPAFGGTNSKTFGIQHQRAYAGSAPDALWSSYYDKNKRTGAK